MILELGIAHYIDFDAVRKKTITRTQRNEIILLTGAGSYD